LLKEDDLLTIGACDNAMTWHRERFEREFVGGTEDFAVWTFRNNPAVLQDPRMYGWVRTDDAGGVTGVSVKVPISDEPMRDHAVIGAFTFRRAGDFLAATDQMIAEDSRIKGEFYVDQAINFALRQGRQGRVVEVDRYICWGTPRDLEVYEYWRGYFLPPEVATDPLARSGADGGEPAAGHLLRYLVVGVVAVALDVGAYAILTGMGWMEPGWAKRGSFVLGAVWAYFANKFFTFRQPDLRAGEPLWFALVYGFGWAANSVVHDILLRASGLSWLAVGMATVISIGINYAGQRWIVFRRGHPNAPKRGDLVS
jgi:putative flippase GtrA